MSDDPKIIIPRSGHNQPLDPVLFEKFLKNTYLIMERCSRRQRFTLMKLVKLWRKQFNIKMWNQGRPVNEIKQSKIIVPVGEMPK